VSRGKIRQEKKEKIEKKSNPEPIKVYLLPSVRDSQLSRYSFVLSWAGIWQP
jgi:hypothetical protein